MLTVVTNINQRAAKPGMLYKCWLSPRASISLWATFTELRRAPQTHPAFISCINSECILLIFNSPSSHCRPQPSWWLGLVARSIGNIWGHLLLNMLTPRPFRTLTFNIFILKKLAHINHFTSVPLLTRTICASSLSNSNSQTHPILGAIACLLNFPGS